MISEFVELFTGLHPLLKVGVVALVILFVIAVIKRLLKVAILVTVLLLLIFVLRAVWNSAIL